jgi:hypothetical protein
LSALEYISTRCRAGKECANVPQGELRLHGVSLGHWCWRHGEIIVRRQQLPEALVDELLITGVNPHTIPPSFVTFLHSEKVRYDQRRKLVAKGEPIPPEVAW